MADDHRAEFVRIMEALDVGAARRIWRHVFPKLPPLKDDHSILTMLHVARTKTDILADKLRFYSHCWLRDHGLSHASLLPDWLKSRAEKMYPVLSEAVGIAVRTNSPVLAPIRDLMQGAMENAVLEAYADRRTEPAFVRKRMFEAKAKAVKKLVG